MGWLVGQLGGQALDLAEDMAQEALLTALARWPWQGLPENPAAWLRTVARNRAIDQLRRSGREVAWTSEREPAGEDRADDVYAARLPDPDLRLVFLCCHPALTEEDRLALTLKVVGGFTARETAAVLLKPETAVAQRLARAKRKLRKLGDTLANEPSRLDIDRRLDTALKVIHLAFSHGYAPRSGAQLVRRDVCLSALRLARALAADDRTGTGASRALAALLCLQSSRLEARETGDGRPILMRDQDRGSWNRDLLGEGMEWLARAREGPLSRYHLEAGIASLHATAPTWEDTDWRTMLGLYESLQQLTDSPVVGVNAAVAQALSGDSRAALERLDALAEHPNLAEYAPYHVARAEILERTGDIAGARAAIRQAQACGLSDPVGIFLDDRLDGGAWGAASEPEGGEEQAEHDHDRERDSQGEEPAG